MDSGRGSTGECPVSPQQRLLTGILFVGLCIAFANLFAVAYVAHERYVYFWDYTVYWDKYRELGGLLCNDPGAGLDRLLRSLRTWEYSDLAILPIAPLACVVGPSRMAFELAMVNLLLIPTGLVGALLMARLFGRQYRHHSGYVFAASLLLFLLLHPVWVSLLEGRPDVVGVAGLFGVLLVYQARPLARPRRCGCVFQMVLLAIVFLARRWYAYWVVAFFPTAFAAEMLRRTSLNQDPGTAPDPLPNWQTHVLHRYRCAAHHRYLCGRGRASARRADSRHDPQPRLR